MSTITLDSRSADNTGFAHTAGDALLAPLKFCGRSWNSLSIDEDTGCLEKIVLVARNVILGALLTLATALAFIPGAVGSLLLQASSDDEPVKETWILQLDEQLKDSCRRIGVDDPRVSAEQIEDYLALDCDNILPGAFAAIEVILPERRGGKAIILQSGGSSFPFFRNLANCFRQPLTEEENETAMKALPNVIFRAGTSTTTESRNLLRNKIASCNIIGIGIDENLESARIAIYK
jgi:hypothetical protein